MPRNGDPGEAPWVLGESDMPVRFWLVTRGVAASAKGSEKMPHGAMQLPAVEYCRYCHVRGNKHTQAL